MFKSAFNSVRRRKKPFAIASGNFWNQFLDLCCVRFLEPMNDHRLRFKSKTCSKKMIKLDNFSKIEIFKFGSNFQVKIHKKSNKSKKNFRCRSACRCRARLGGGGQDGAERRESFFLKSTDFFTGRGVSGSGKPSGSGNFFYFYCFFLCILT